MDLIAISLGLSYIFMKTIIMGRSTKILSFKKLFVLAGHISCGIKHHPLGKE